MRLMGVRRAGAGDEDLVRDVRMQALADAPDDFDSTLEEARAWTTEEWRAWISRGATFLFEDARGVRGIAAGDPHRSDRGAVFLEALWVHPDLRGTGTAGALVGAVLSWAEVKGAARVWLHVVKSNGRARRFYEKLGFRPTGKEVVREREGMLEVEMVYEPASRVPG
jgi:GNAT superfamily N-acetyltransferase